jgi:NADH:ubiquinone oxidoreductase subunit 5 (subunit L)/multisubunit Na+/H+ antiporter MnhA subunit
LGEYFEYDASAASIVALSSIFSQLALMLFSSKDVVSVIALWEAISVVSFFLVQHWSMRLPSFKAGLKVFTVSQVGDLPLVLALLFLATESESADFSSAWVGLTLSATSSTNLGGMWVGSAGVVLALSSFAMLLKAAQFVFYPWLLEAMEAPVPISSQLHSSTLVVIGFYVYVRVATPHHLPGWLSSSLVGAGAVTAASASALGFFQADAKRLLACSTAGQLGYVTTGLGLGLTEESLALLCVCCCGKAYSFVWLGVFMERWGGLSDLRLVGGSHSSLAERAGLASAGLNLTVAPGAFAWHAKAVLVGGGFPQTFWGSSAGLELLSITWALSGSYIARLVFLATMSVCRTTPLLADLPAGSPLGSPTRGRAIVPYLVVSSAALTSWGWGALAGC